MASAACGVANGGGSRWVVHGEIQDMAKPRAAGRKAFGTDDDDADNDDDAGL